jgi:hypothetical protein
VADLFGAIAFLEMHPQLRLRALELPTEADRLSEVVEQIRLLAPPAVQVYLYRSQSADRFLLNQSSYP